MEADYKNIVRVQYTGDFKYDEFIPFSMVRLDAVVDEALLERNYNKLVDPLAARKVILGLRMRGDTQGHSPEYMKRFTKVAMHVLKKHPGKLDGLVERLFRVTEEGIAIAAANLDSGIPHIGALHSHMYAYHADFARVLWEKTRDIAFAKIWYQSGIKAANFTVELDPKEQMNHPTYVADQHSFAVASARTLGRETGDVNWFKKAFGHARFSHRMYKILGKEERAAHCMVDVAKIWGEYSFVTKNPENFEQYYFACLDAVEDLLSAGKPGQALGTMYNRAAGAARKMILYYKDQEKTEDTQLEKIIWLERRLDCLRNSATICREYDVDSAILRYNISKGTAHKLFDLTWNPVWLEVAYDSCASSALIQAGVDKAKAAVSEQYAAKAAYTVFYKSQVRDGKGNIVRDPFWLEMAFKHRMRSVSLFDEVGPVTDSIRAWNNAEECAEELYVATLDLQWKEKVYDLRFERAEISMRKGNLNEGIMGYVHAGDAAMYVMQESAGKKRELYRDLATACYENFRSVVVPGFSRQIKKRVTINLRKLGSEEKRSSA